MDENIIFNKDDPQEYTENRDMSLKLKNALSQLDESKKELFLRYYYYGQKVKDAAADMNINPSTAKIWLKRGREELKEILSRDGIVC